MEKMIKTIIIGLLMAILSTFNYSQVFAQKLEVETISEDGVTYTRCFDVNRSNANLPSNGAKINGKLVIPCKYYFIRVSCGYIFAHLTSVRSIADVYMPDGKLLFPASKGIINVSEFPEGDLMDGQGRCHFFDQQNNRYDEKGNLVTQCIRKRSTYSDGGVTYTKCYDYLKSEPNNGAIINGKLVVPCKYGYITGRSGFLFAYSSGNYSGPADVYSSDGRLLFPVSKGIEGAKNVEKMGKILFYDKENNWYDETGKFVFKGDLSNIIVGSSGEVYIKTGTYRHWGILDTSGAEILAPEFEDCDYLGNNLFSFKMNSYWGVMKKDGTIIIPLSRQYSSLNYSRTFKKFTFEKRINNVVYKGECNANGVQTVIQKDHTINTTPTQKKETKPEKNTTTTTQTEKKTEPAPTPQPQPQPQPRQPQPMQVWMQCYGCNGSGQCHICGGLGWKYTTYDSHATCTTCGGSGKCNMCAGNGGHYEIQYR